MREQREILERDADAACFRGRLGDVAAFQKDRAGVQLLDPGDEPQQHRLADARGAEHADDLALLDRQREAIEHFAGLIGFRQRLEFDLRHDQPFTAPSDRPSTR
jgi:hypothetical protein